MFSESVRGPILPDAQPPSWPDATWIGEFVDPDSLLPDARCMPTPTPIPLARSDGYARARLLVRGGDGRPRCFVTVPVVAGTVDPATIRRELSPLPESAPPTEPTRAAESPPISVVLCTRDRPGDLAIALGSLLKVDYPDFEVVVVDNASSTDGTVRTVNAIADPRVRVVREPAPGLSNARNAGVAAARHDWVAFTDDDVIVDRGWLAGIARGARSSHDGRETDAVAGLVATAELRTPEQAWFDARVSWGKLLRPRLYDVRRPPIDIPLFPFRVGAYGTGANFAVRRTALAKIGGFDPRLGAGSRARGGEDIDFFYRLVVRGNLLAYEPSALVWHRHRATPEALEAQAVGYGRGFSAWLTKLLLSPADLARGVGVLVRHPSLVRKAPPAETDHRTDLPGTEHISAIERRALVGGPSAYLSSLWHAP